MVWRETWQFRNLGNYFHPHEWWMGDPAYHSGPHVTVKYRKHKLCALLHDPLPRGVTCNCPNGRLPAEKVCMQSWYLSLTNITMFYFFQIYNTTFGGYRGRVEKILAKVTVLYLHCIVLYCMIWYTYYTGTQIFQGQVVTWPEDADRRCANHPPHHRSMGEAPPAVSRLRELGALWLALGLYSAACFVAFIIDIRVCVCKLIKQMCT